MDDDALFKFLEMVKRRIQFLGKLEQAVLDNQTAMICSDIEAIERSLQLQDEICQQIMQLDGELRDAWVTLEKGVSAGDTVWTEIERLGPGTAQQFERAQWAHDQAQQRIRHLSGVQAALIRRSSRTLAAMRSVITSQYPGYRAGRHGQGIVGTYGAMQGWS